MKKMISIGSVTILLVTLFAACRKGGPVNRPTDKYPADVAVEWMKLHMRLSMTTPGFNSVVTSRSVGYAGLTLYESIVPGIKDHQSIAPQLNNGHALKLKLPIANKPIYAPAAANAAMAVITKSLFGNTSPANLKTIDSLDAALTAGFLSRISAGELEAAESFGTRVATAIFEWSRSDGGHEAYLRVTDPTYTPPVGVAFWIPTPAAFSAPIHPRWGANRSFVPGIPAGTAAPAPIPYSPVSGSPYDQQATELYEISKKLSADDSVIVKFWGDLATNYNVPAHATGILTQLIELKQLQLAEAAVAYARHGIAQTDVVISLFKAKYTYNTVRPISYIRSVQQRSTWNTVIPTPPHPEYPAAHGGLSGATESILANLFGKNVSFTDHTYDKLYGPRTFRSFEHCALEGGLSRVLGGIHYRPSVMAGLTMGRQVGDMVNGLAFSSGGKK